MLIDTGWLYLYEPFACKEVSRGRKPINTVEDLIDYLRYYDTLDDCYISIYSYDKEKIIIDKLFFDFDGREGFVDAKLFNQKLHEHKISFLPVASGSKGGIHTYVPITPVLVDYECYEDLDNCISASDVLWSTLEDLLRKLDLVDKKGKLMLQGDTHVLGNPRQLAKIPQTIHPSWNRYCTYLPHDWFKTFTLNKLFEYIKKKHPFEGTYVSKRYPTVEKKSNKNLFAGKERKKVPQTDFNASKQTEYMYKYLEPFMRPKILENFLRYDAPHWARTAGICELIPHGFKEEELVKICAKIGWGDYREHGRRGTRYHIKRILKKKLKPWKNDTVEVYL